MENELIKEWPDASGNDDHGREDVSSAMSKDRKAMIKSARERALRIQAVRKDKISKESDMIWQKTENGIIKIMEGETIVEALNKDQSFDALRSKVSAAINANIKAGTDMDGDNDGMMDYNDYAWVMDLFPGFVVYSMNGKLFQCPYAVDAEGDVNLGKPQEVKDSYVPVTEESVKESFDLASDFTTFGEFIESGYTPETGAFSMTIIKPGLSKNNRFYSADLLKKSAGIFEGCKMFADHATEAESKAKPEGSVNNWMAQITKVYTESDGTIKGSGVVVDPVFKSKLDLLHKNGLLKEMGVSIRAMGRQSDGEMDGKKIKVVESLSHARSVDFVTFAGAGGQVETLS